MFSNPQANRPRQPQPPASFHSQLRLDTSPIDLISSKTGKLYSHRDFVRYSPVIHAMLEADDYDLRILRSMRQRISSTLFQNFYANLYNSPPQDIFHLVLQIRADKSWNTMRQDVLMQVNDARRHSGSSWTSSHGSGHAPSNNTYVTPATVSNFSRPRERRFGSPVPQQSHSGYLSQLSGRDVSSSCAEGSPTSAEGLSSAVIAGRTAPPGYYFYCPSKNCRKSYSRQGHYENHMQRCHAEIPIHDPATSLRKISSPGQTSVDEFGGHSRPITARGVPAPTTPQPGLSTPMLHTPFSHSPMRDIVPLPAPNPLTVLSDTLQSGTSPQTSLPQKRPLDTDMSLSAFQYGSSQLSFDFLDGAQQFLETPPSQTISNSNLSFYSTGSRMGS